MKNHALTFFIASTAFALGALGAYGALFYAFSAARAEAEAAANEVARIETEDAAIENAEEIIAALSADEAVLSSYFVSTDGIVAFLEELERSGEELGTAVEVASVSPATAPGGRLTIALRIEGSFASVMRTLGSLEYGPRDLRIVTLALDTPPSGEDASWVAAATFSAATLEQTP